MTCFVSNLLPCNPQLHLLHWSSMSHHHIQIFHLRYRASLLKMPHLSTILESFTNSSILFCYPQRHLQWSTMPTMSTIPGCILSRCEEDVIQHMDLFLVPRLQNFYEGREASTREDHLPRGKRRMNEINGLPNLLSCSHNRTLFKIGLLHSLKVVVLLTKRGHTTSSSPNNRVALDNSI